MSVRSLRLPAAVLDLAMRLGVTRQDAPPIVSLTQTGRMKRDLDADSWMAFTACQTISTHASAFEWRARAGPLGLISAVDALRADEGRFDIMALGIIPLARARHTPALMRGELMRYLAEIAWAPHAILHNHALDWQVIDAETLSVSAGVDETKSQVLLSLDSEGRIGAAFAADRPRAATAPLLPTPWRGHFSDYRLHHGIWVPFSAQVAWEIDGRARPYWQGCLESWTTDAGVGSAS